MRQSSALRTHPDDTPVASAKAGPSSGLGEADDEAAGNNGRLWRTVLIGEQEHRIDMQVIRPYLRVITHGGQQRRTKKTVHEKDTHFWPQWFLLIIKTLFHQDITARASMPSLSSPPVTCLTVVPQTTTTSWKISSCKSDVDSKQQRVFNRG